MKCMNVILAMLFVSCFLLVPYAGNTQESVAVNKESGTEYRAALDLFNNNKYSEAADHFKRAYELDNRNIDALFAQGFALSKEKKFKTAAEILQVLDTDPKHQKALKLLPTTLASAGDTEKALEAYDKGIEEMPDNYFFYFGKAVLHLQNEMYEKAVPLLKNALEKDPQNLSIQEKLMYAYSKMGRSEDSYAIALKILDKDENNAHARIAAADFKRLSGQYKDAIEEYKIAAKNIETKAYAEHFIEVILQKLEEIEIEKEYQERQKNN